MKRKTEINPNSFSKSSSEDENEIISIDFLKRCENSIKESSKLLSETTIFDNPESIENHIRSLLNRNKTYEAKLNTIQTELSNFSRKYQNTQEVSLIRTKIEREMEEFNIKIHETEESNKILENQLNQMKNNFSNNEDIQKELNNHLNNKNFITSEISKLHHDIKIENDNYSEKFKNKHSLENQTRLLEQEIFKISDTLKEEPNDPQQELAKIRLNRLNLEKAHELLIVEAEKRQNAFRTQQNIQKEQLEKFNFTIQQDINNLEKDLNKITNFKNEISKFEVLISREENRKEINIDQPSIPQKMNKNRLSRLIMLLFTEGPSEEIIQSIGNELSWSIQQINDFKKLLKEKSPKGIGSLWEEWLDSITNEIE